MLKPIKFLFVCLGVLALFGWASTPTLTSGANADNPLSETVLPPIGNPIRLGAWGNSQNIYLGISVDVSGDTAVASSTSTGVLYVYVRSGEMWHQQAVLAPEETTPPNLFYAVAIDGDTLVASNFQPNEEGNYNNSLYIFVRSGETWSQQAELALSEAQSFSWDVDIMGDTIVAGSHSEEERSGTAYIFTRSGTIWSQQARLTASDAAEDDYFGYAVALSGDTVLVSAPPKNQGAGAVYAFVQVGEEWHEQAILTSAHPSPGLLFGYSIALDGDTALIGALRDDTQAENQGSAELFVRSGSTWSQQATLTASNGTAYDQFGYAVAITGDTAVISAVYDDSENEYGGAIYIFTRSGTTWQEQANLDYRRQHESDYFGLAIALDGNTAVVTAPTDSYFGPNSGSVYIFVGSNNQWQEQAKLGAEVYTPYEQFGFAVDTDHFTTIVGAPGEPDHSTTPGSATIYVYDDGRWHYQATLTPSDGLEDAQFGYAVAIEGDTAVVGAIGDDEHGADSGAVYVFVRSGESWTQQAKLTAADGVAFDQFGQSVALQGQTILIGAKSDSLQTGYGYVFVRSGTNWSQQTKLTIPSAFPTQKVALDNHTAVLSSPLDPENEENQGSIYIFVRSNETWSQQTKLTENGAKATGSFGQAIAIDDDKLVVGVPTDDTQGLNSGSAYVFVRSGEIWAQQAQLVASNATAEAHFGASVAIKGDDIAVGAPEMTDQGVENGQAYIFFQSDENGTEAYKFSLAELSENAKFGYAIAWHGTHLVVGVPSDNLGTTDSGSAYVFATFHYYFTVNKSGLGSGLVASEPKGIFCGSTCIAGFLSNTVVTLTATAETGSTFAGWSGHCSGMGQCVVTVDQAHTVTAAFEPLEQHSLTVSKTGTGSGLVTSTPAGINCGADCEELFTDGTVVTLTATAETGSAFTGWGGSCSGMGSCVVTVDQVHTVTAAFTTLTPPPLHTIFLPLLLTPEE